jgi:hypothetical protein
VTSLLFENFADYSGTRDSRVFALARARAEADLAGRSVWCATAIGGSSAGASALRGCVPGALGAEPIELAKDEPLRRIAQRLRALLSRRGDERLDRADAEDLEDVVLRGERIVGDAVGAGDVVVLEDPLGVLLAPALRERGAHAVLEVRPGSSRGRRGTGPGERVLRGCDAALEARVMIWLEHGRAGVKRIATAVTSEDVATLKEITAPGSEPDQICWTTILAEIVELDRIETVGGMLHVRPTVAAR